MLHFVISTSIKHSLILTFLDAIALEQGARRSLEGFR